MQSALLDGVEVIAWELTDEEFASVKERYRSDRDCLRFRDGLRAIPRGGPLRGNHFAHRPGEGGHFEPETVHHIRAKKAIRDAAVPRGWAVTIEARHPEGLWQADVFVEKDSRRIAFEVQWSAQSITDFQRRTERYHAEGVETVWLVRSTMRVFHWLRSEFDVIPLAECGLGLHSFYALEPALQACFDVLEDDARQSNADPIHRHRCYKCNRVWFSTEIGKAWGEKRSFTEEELHVLGRWAGVLRLDYSHTIGESYPMWHCPHCKRKQGDYYLTPGRPEIVHGGTVIPDPRTGSLWEAMQKRLDEVGVATIEPSTTRVSSALEDPGIVKQRVGQPGGKRASGHCVTDEESLSSTELRHLPVDSSASGERQRGLSATSTGSLDLDAIRRETANDTRPADDPARIRERYARTLRAGRDLVSPSQHGSDPSTGDALS